jgi:6-phosphogluconolactonase (cycloisomerase 2 family)
VAVTPDGAFLVVTERASDRIVTYAIDENGALGEPVVNESEGQTPFGFQFRSDGVFVVSEAFGGGDNPGASAASSYRVSDGGLLWTFSASVPDGETAACWIQIVRDRFVYTTNTGSDTVSAYELDEDGAITLFPNGGIVAELGPDHSPIDMAISADEAFLYVANAAADDIVGFAIAEDGTLSSVGDPTPVPATAVGLIGF